MAFYVYKITEEATGKVYVGMTKSPKFRWVKHRALGKRAGTGHPLYDAMYASNRVGFTFAICREYETREEAWAGEREYVERTQATDPRYGFNRDPGGSTGDAKRGRPKPEDVRRKISDKHKGKKLTPEHVAKIVSARAAYRPSEATKEKMRQSALGRVISDEQRKQISATMTGRKLSEAHKANIGAARIGRKNTEETKEKMRQAAYRRIERQRGSAAKGY